MNQVHPKKLLHSKWTALHVKNKEKHFTVVEVEFDDLQNLIRCVVLAVYSQRSFEIAWRDLKDSTIWKTGWV
jgi:tryptophan-rich hypothetical protein